jgi:hypothetical protein
MSLAADTRLDRTVAIKVLPEHFADSLERKARFEREAKAISQLNHPHICILHDVGEQDGVDYLVMEYIEGETLAERLKKGPLKLDQALEYGIQVADALDKAHRAGIVHRDLKQEGADERRVHHRDAPVHGNKAFEGESQASLMSAIMKDAPRPMSALAPIAPPLLERTALQCLEKDPDERWQSLPDVGRQLQWLDEGLDSEPATGKAVSSRWSAPHASSC